MRVTVVAKRDNFQVTFLLLMMKIASVLASRPLKDPNVAYFSDAVLVFPRAAC